MPRFPINSSQLTGNKAKISGENFRHIIKVLRLKINDPITLFDEKLNEHIGKIISIDKKELSVEIADIQKNNRESHIKINIFQSVPKGSKMDLIVQKATELGTYSITPIKTERSIVQDSRKRARWLKIILESCKQCGRSRPTVINSNIEYKNIVKNISDNDLSLLFYENAVEKLKDFLRRQNDNYKTINIIVGPEGGFTTQEITFALDNKINVVGLGPRILRVETASIAAVSAIQYHFGDF